jgi:hypothetical protein
VDLVEAQTFLEAAIASAVFFDTGRYSLEVSTCSVVAGEGAAISFSAST